MSLGEAVQESGTLLEGLRRGQPELSSESARNVVQVCHLDWRVGACVPEGYRVSWTAGVWLESLLC